MRLCIPPVLQVIICVALAWIAGQTFPQLSISVPFGTIIAIMFAAVGLLLLFLALRLFSEKRTTIDPLRPERAENVITSGIYGMTRNPMYLGLLLIVVAAAVAVANPVSLLAPVLFVFAMNELQIKPEEQALSQKFGPSYTGYCERVRRWI